ncbi:MAG: hypothetical protein ACJ752_04600 [Gaiellaceae bacterium]
MAHEDDPEPAVRAALAIREWAGESEDLSRAAGRDHGRRSDSARRSSAQGYAAGDVVNTAARLQSGAARSDAATKTQASRRAAAARTGPAAAAASLDDHEPMLAAHDREQDRELLQTLQRVIELERELSRGI